MVIDAMAFLDSLVIPELHALDKEVPVTPDDLPADWYVEWDMRAAHLEYDAGLPRERAERLALNDILRHMAESTISE
jgi:hypothetical protein